MHSAQMIGRFPVVNTYAYNPCDHTDSRIQSTRNDEQRGEKVIACDTAVNLAVLTATS